MIIRSLRELDNMALLKIKDLTLSTSPSSRITRVWLSNSISSMGF